MLKKSQAFAVSVVVLLSCGVSAWGAPAHRPERPLTYFVAHRKNLEIKIQVGPRQVVWTSTGSLVHCEGGRKEGGSLAVQGWRGFPIRQNGDFHKSVTEAYEGSGWYFTALEGRVHPNRIVGHYRSWEERTGEETFFPRCGTRSPKGEDMRFIAHRVDGPPWRPR